MKKDFPENNRNIIVQNLAVLLLLLFLMTAYFIETNKIIENNYNLVASQKILKEKKAQNQNLQANILEVHSLRGLGDRAKEMKLVSIEQVKYLESTAEVFAVAKNR